MHSATRTRLEADNSMLERFHNLPPESRENLANILRCLERDPNCSPDAVGAVDGNEVRVKDLSGGWVCAWVPIYSELYPATGIQPLLMHPEKIVVCLYEIDDVEYQPLPPISS